MRSSSMFRTIRMSCICTARAMAGLRRFLVPICIGILTASLVSLVPLPARAAVTVHGAISCGTWTKWSAEEGIDGTNNGAKVWILGYLSGLAVGC